MNKILLTGFVCLSLGALAQTGAGAGKATDENAAPKDAATGQASGKRMHQPMVIHRDLAARDAASGKATGKTMASDDWSAKQTGSSNGQASTPVATGDVNGDGTADLTAAKSSGHASEKSAVLDSSTKVQSPRDVATGQASGKRQHQPVTIKKETDASSPK